jgi:hypothetical protein
VPSDHLTCVVTRGGDDEPEWLERWLHLNCILPHVIGPRSEGWTGEHEEIALTELKDFWVKAYQLKDALKADPSVASHIDIEGAIRASDTFVLLADLANGYKHPARNQPPRSGDYPNITRVSSIASTGSGGWRLQVVIEHKSAVIDGYDFASKALEEWRAHLQRWGLV